MRENRMRGGVSFSLRYLVGESRSEKYDLYDLQDNNIGATIEAKHEDVFFPRVTIGRNFDWGESTILAVRVNYSRDRDEKQCFEFPRIIKPSSPQDITVDLHETYLRDGEWRIASS